MVWRRTLGNLSPMIPAQFTSQTMTQSILSLHCVAWQSRGGFKKTMAFQPRVIKQRLCLLWSFLLAEGPA